MDRNTEEIYKNVVILVTKTTLKDGFIHFIGQNMGPNKECFGVDISNETIDYYVKDYNRIKYITVEDFKLSKWQKLGDDFRSIYGVHDNEFWMYGEIAKGAFISSVSLRMRAWSV